MSSTHPNRIRISLIVSCLACALCGACEPPSAADTGGTDATPTSDAVPGVPDSRAAQDSDAASPSFVMATANLRCMVDGWDSRLPLLANAIARLAPDVIALQEACSDAARDGLAELVDAIGRAGGPTYRSRRTTTHVAWDRYDEGIALLSQDDFIADEVVALPVGVFPRKMIVARVALGDRTVVIAATHLSHGDQASIRAQQMTAARNAIATFRNGGEAAVLAGDFNETPDRAGIVAHTAAGYRDSWASTRPDDAGATVPADAPQIRIDYVFVNAAVNAAGNAAANPVATGQFMDASTDGVWPSDHRGVWAQITLE